MFTTNIILFLNLGGGEIFLVVIFVVMFFGTDKLPEMMRAFGRGMREMKNATAEIQREIEKGANEIQRDINVKEHLDELKEATDKIQGRLTEGLNDLEEHHNPKTEISESTAPTEDEKENPLVPPSSVKRDS
jgi:sec-independent protein translocase protein TatA